MAKKIYTFPPHEQYGGVFGIANTLSGLYVCPGWHKVPDGTTRDQIRFHPSAKVAKAETAPVITKTENRSWQVEASKPGKFYTVSEKEGRWDCTCPAKTFHRGDCKHIKAKKNELIPA